MSASHPKATEPLRSSEMTLSAKTGLMTVQQMEISVRSFRWRFAAADKRWWLSTTRADGLVLPMHTYSKKGKAVACRSATSFAAVVMGISCIATDASATCMLKAKKDIIVILDVGHTDKDSGQISARGVKEYDLNMKLARRVLEELVNTGFISTQMIVTSGSNTHESRLHRSKRANDLGADLFISVHHDGVKNETLMPWQYNGKTHWFLDKFEGFSLWVSQKNNKYEESLSFATTLADRLMASGLKFTTHHDELTNTAKYGRVAPLVDRERGIYDASDHIAVLYESRMPAVLLEAGMIVNRAEEQVLSSPALRATVAKAVAEAVERFCAVS
jgi:N-acetylmuramoyl-L-alanine amidase